MTRDKLVALASALLVTFLWSSSYVLVKFGLGEIQPITLVALRYLTATVILVPIALKKGGEPTLRVNWKNFLLLGFLGYTVAQGLQCVGLSYLPAVSVTFILNLTPLIVLILGFLLFKETPTSLQLLGATLVISGAYIYFGGDLSYNITGFMITLASGLGWAAYLVLGRRLFKDKRIDALSLTAFSMSFGTVFMVILAFIFEGVPVVSYSSWGIILWLGLLNTAVAFFLWNRSLQKVDAFQISILQNTMLIQIAILAWIFLGEQITPEKILPMTLVFTGALIVQVKGNRD